MKQSGRFYIGREECYVKSEQMSSEQPFFFLLARFVRYMFLFASRQEVCFQSDLSSPWICPFGATPPLNGS